jgi:hypothetical protein
MMTPIPSAITLLADLAEHGIDVQLRAGAIRYRPMFVMTPVFMRRMQALKAELLQLLDTDASVTGLRQSIERFWKDMAWRAAWEQRFKAANYANFDSLRHMQGSVIDMAERHHQRYDWQAFASACRYLRRLASGEEWDSAEPIQDSGRWDIET